MEKISCEVVRDLLPLYCDDICSQDSRSLIELHLKQCSECRRLLRKMQLKCGGSDRNHTDSMQEQQDERIVKNIAFVWKKSIIKSFLKGVLVTLCSCFILAGIYWALTRMVMVPFSSADIEAMVENITDDHIEIHVTIINGKKAVQGQTAFTEDGRCYITVKHGVIAMKNADGQRWESDFSIPRVGITEDGKRIQIKEIYCGMEGDGTLIWKWDQVVR